MRSATLACALAALLIPTAQAGSSLVANSWTVYRGGTVFDWQAERNILLHDRFDDQLPLQGPALADTGLPAHYQLEGVPGAGQAAAAQERSGQLRLDPALADVSANAAGDLGRSLRLHLVSDAPGDGLGLARASSFGVALEVAAGDMPSPGFSFGMRLSDGPSNLNNVLDLALNGSAAGPQRVLVRQDFAAGTVTLLAQSLLTVPASADSVVLGFVHATPGSAVVQASWGFVDAANHLVGGLPVFSTGLEIFHAADPVQLSLLAVQAVPEPASLSLMLAGLAGPARNARPATIKPAAAAARPAAAAPREWAGGSGPRPRPTRCRHTRRG